MQLLSIVLPTRNRADQMAEAVESVRNQSYRDWELIIVDDASIDATAERLDEIVKGDERIKCIRNPVQEGVGVSLNHGFELARGDLLTWTSDDNLYRPAAVEVMVKMIEHHDLVYSAMTLVDDVGQTIGHAKALPINELLFRNVVGSCFLYRRKVMDRVGAYDTHLLLIEDWDYWIRAAKFEFKMHPIPTDLYECGTHIESLLEQNRHSLEGHVERLLHKHLGSLKEPHRSACLLHLADIEWRRGCKREAKRYGRKAFGATALKHYRGELMGAFFGAEVAKKWTKTSVV